MIRVDTHLHTAYSHAKDSVDAMFAAAVAKDIDIVGFSEHSPRPATHSYPKDYQKKLTSGFPRYVQEVLRVRDANKCTATVLLGIEMDWMEGREGFIIDMLKAYDFDYVIGGVHFIDTWGFDYAAEDWDKLHEFRKVELYAQYFESVYNMAQSGYFNILAHPDLVKIFSNDLFREWSACDEARTLFRKSLTAVRDAGMAMEISSAGLRKPCDEIYPCHTIMEIASDLCLPISFGSDAHNVNDVAADFAQLEFVARTYGYHDSAYFVKRSMRSIAF